MIYTYVINIILNYKHILYTEVTHTNYFISSLNIYADKIPVSNSSVLSIYLFASKMLYNSSGLSLNKSINLTSIGL